MSQNQNIALELSAVGSQDYSLVPMNDRSGVFSWNGYSAVADTLFTTDLPIYATASVRAGRAANYNVTPPVERVKRKALVKLRIPVYVPGPGAEIVDFIDISTEISAPVDASDAQVTAAIAAAGLLVLKAPIDDMIISGREPF